MDQSAPKISAPSAKPASTAAAQRRSSVSVRSGATATLYARGMSTAQPTTIVTGVDFVSVPTQDLERAAAFYGETLGLPRSMYKPERNFAEFETGTVTLSVVDPERMGIGSFRPNANHLAIRVDDVAEA